jgi:dihydroorotate dehydrogenase
MVLRGVTEATYRRLYKHIFTRIDAERAHEIGLLALRLGGLPVFRRLLRAAAYGPDLPGVQVEALGRRFAHPLGLAAGFDKDGVALHGLAALGFSHIEAGTVTPQPQPGNPAPRLFRLTHDRALINRLGFPSGGVEHFAANFRGRPVTPIGVSVGKNKATPLDAAARDYVAVIRRLRPQADYFAVNVSSPNTPELRRLQTPDYLDDLLAACAAAAQRTPLLVKIAPDLDWAEIDTVIGLALKHRLAGIIATNTTLRRDDLRDPSAGEVGGLSGLPLRDRATDIIRHIYRSAGKQLVIIGVGGIFSGADAWDKLCAGATLLQAYTGFIYRGPTYVRRVVEDLAHLMRDEGVTSLQEVIGRGR